MFMPKISLPSADQPVENGSACGGHNRDLGQYFTPTWAAEALVQHYFPDLTPRDFVVEPACGHGAFLGAIPQHVPAIGVEIDDAVAARARHNSGRQVICGDFRTVSLPHRPTAIIGNPPFSAQIVEAFLDRANELMEDGGRVGLILPAYILQTPTKTMAYSRTWSLHFDLIPRTLFRGISMPVCFTLFTKSRSPVMQGLFLYAEAAAIESLDKAYKRVLARAPNSAWAHAVAQAVHALGGKATLQQIYDTIGGRRPSNTAWWREKVRQVAQKHLTRVDEGTYALAA